MLIYFGAKNTLFFTSIEWLRTTRTATNINRAVLKNSDLYKKHSKTSGFAKKHSGFYP
jgi:hypothetical protein